MKKFIPYGKQSIDASDKKAVLDVLSSDFLTQGPKIEEFEKALAKYTGAKYAVAVANGTAALHLAAAALDILKGSEGITTPITFVASANCLLYNDIAPVFADIDPVSYNIDPSEIAKKLTKKTKVLIPVHFAGQPAKMKEISRLAREHKLYVIEDAAHAIGSKYADGTRVGNCKYSDLTTFSFHPVKTITTGEGGAITTNNQSLYERLLILRTHGITKNSKVMSQNPGPWYYEMQMLGFNYRLTDIQAALGLSQLKKLNRFIQKRRWIVKKYNQAFGDLPNVTIPFESPDVMSAFHLYVLKIDFDKIGKSRKQVIEELKARNIGTQVHYIPVHFQPYYRKQFGFRRGDYPIAEEYYEQALSLPLYPKMSQADVTFVIKNLKDILR